MYDVVSTSGLEQMTVKTKVSKTCEAYIPASRRPDGTWRKPRRVKEGYIPQEEMPTYENKGVKWLKSRSDLPPGLNPEDAAAMQAKKEGTNTDNMSKTAKRNAKRKEKKIQQQTQEMLTGVTQKLANTSVSNGGKASSNAVGSKAQAVKSETCAQGDGDSEKQELTKKIRNLRKKLKQVEELERKIGSGELKNPEKEQLEKVAKKKELLEEIADLEIDLKNA